LTDKKKAQTEPRRRRWKKRVTLVLALSLALAVAFVVLTRTRLVPYQLSKYLNEHMLEDSRFEFSCEAVTGDLVNQVILHQPVVRYHGEDASYNVFRADRIAIDYSIAGVFRLNLVVQELELDNVHLQIRRDEEGRIIVPVPLESGLGDEGGAFAPRVEVQQFDVNGLSLFFGGEERELAVRDVNLVGSYLLEKGEGRIRVDGGSAYIVDSETPVQSFQMDVYHDKESVRIQDVTVRLGRSLVMGNGEIKDGRFHDLRLTFNPVVLEELHALGLIPDHHGEMGGTVELNGDLDEISIEGTVTGSGFGLVMNNLDFRSTLGADGVDIDSLRGEIFGAMADGSFWYGWGNRTGYGYSGKFTHLDLANGFLAGRGLPAMNLNGSGSMHYDGEETYTISVELDSATIDRYEAGRGTFVGEWHDRRGLDIESYWFERPGYVLEGSGTVDTEGYTHLLFSAAGNDLANFWDYASLPRIGGAVDVGGRITGPTSDLQINLNGTARNVRYLFAGIDSATVQADIRGVGGDDVTASVDVTGNRVTISGKPFYSPHLRFQASSTGPTVVRDFSFARGDTFTTMDFNVVTSGEDVVVKMNHVEVAMPEGEWRNRSPSSLVVGPQFMRLDSLVLVSGNSVVGVDGVYSEGAGTVRVDAWGERFDLALLRQAFDLPFRLSGVGRFGAKLRGRIENPEASLVADVSAGALDSLEFDRLQLGGEFADQRWQIDRLLVIDDGDSISGSGWWDFPTSPVTLVRGDSRTGAGEAGLGAPFGIKLDCRHYPVPKAMRAVHAPVYVGGAFSGTVEMAGTPGNPEVTIEGTVSPPGGPGPPTSAGEIAQGVQLPETRLRITHRDGQIHLSRVTVGGGANTSLTGTLPVALSAADGLTARTDEPIQIELVLDSTSVEPVLAYTTRLAGLSGRADGRVTITGTFSKPEFRGNVELRDCHVKFVELDERYTDIDASLEFRGDELALTRIRGKSRENDAFNGSGMLKLDGFRPVDYRLDMSLTDFWVSRSPELEALVDGNLSVEMYEDGDRKIPNITGRLTAKQAEVLYLFDSTGGPPNPVTLPSATPGWICNIDIVADKNLWVRNPDMNIELSGQLILKRDHGGLFLGGDLSALRGSYTVYNNRFEVVEGTLDFSAAEGVRPAVYINAYTPLRIEDGKEERIYLTLSWPRDKIEPEIQLSSTEPGYYQSDLWRMLGGSDLAGGLAANALEKLLNQQMSGMTVYVDRRVTGRTSGGSQEHEMSIGVGKYLWEDLYLTYRQGITLTADQAVSVEYRLRNMISIRSGIIRHTNPRYAGSVLRNTDTYNLDVNFRWEY
jgi:hypothetical protein